jgi:hypothetical protein
VVSIDCGCLLCLAVNAGASASSSPEASREEGCCITAVSDFRRSLGMCEILFRLAEPLEDGDDIFHKLELSSCDLVQEGLQFDWTSRKVDNVRKDGQQGLPIDQALGGRWFPAEDFPSRLTAGHSSIVRCLVDELLRSCR